MRRTTAVFAAAIMMTGWGWSASAGRIDDGLAATLFDTGQDEVVSVLVYLADRVDIKALDAELTQRRVSRQYRHEMVVRSLQEKAEATQSPILEHLAQLQRDGLVVSYNAYWLANMIHVEAIHSEILLIAQRDDVDTVFADFEIEMITPINAPEFGGPAEGPMTGDTTTGVEAVRAPEVWDMGFTGAGVLVATLDTGVDGLHEALGDRWRGLDERYVDNPEWAWFDPVTGTDFPQSFGSSHGTHTMGSVCGGPPGEHVGVAPGRSGFTGRPWTVPAETPSKTRSPDSNGWLIPTATPRRSGTCRAPARTRGASRRGAAFRRATLCSGSTSTRVRRRVC